MTAIEASPELRRLLAVNPEVPAESSRIVLEGRRFSVTHEQLERWKKAYPNVYPSIIAELQVADDHYFEKPAQDGKYLGRVSRWLEKANMEGKERKRQADRDSGRAW